MKKFARIVAILLLAGLLLGIILPNIVVRAADTDADLWVDPANATCWNLLDNMVEFSKNTELEEEEIAVFEAMIAMYENVQEHCN
jgi:hypothetical protein